MSAARSWTMVLTILSLRVLHGAALSMANQSRLRRNLFIEYNKDIRPQTGDKPVKVQLALSIVRLSVLDLKSETLECHAWLRMSWRDISLKWNPDQFGGIQEFRISADRLWLPDIKLYNSVDHVDNHDPRTLALVRYDGTVFYVPRVTLKTHCAIQLSPMGTALSEQECQLQLGSWTYNGHLVSLSNSTDASASLRSYLHKSKYEWAISNVTSVLTTNFYPCCLEPYEYMMFTLKIQRQTYSPSFAESEPYEKLSEDLLFVSEIRLFNIGAILFIPLIFLLPFESRGKILIACTAMVCLTFILLRSPGTAIAKLCETNIILVGVAMFVSSILHNLWYSDYANRALPGCLHKVVNVFAKVLCILRQAKPQTDDSAQLHAADDSIRVNVTLYSDLYTWRTLVLILDRLFCVIFLVATVLSNVAL